jgi:hypothetical protein
MMQKNKNTRRKGTCFPQAGQGIVDRMPKFQSSC